MRLHRIVTLLALALALALAAAPAASEAPAEAEDCAKKAAEQCKSNTDAVDRQVCEIKRRSECDPTRSDATLPKDRIIQQQPWGVRIERK